MHSWQPEIECPEPGLAEQLDLVYLEKLPDCCLVKSLGLNCYISFGLNNGVIVTVVEKLSHLKKLLKIGTFRKSFTL